MQLQIQPLTSKNWNDFEQLFSACAQCKECWCLNHRVSPDAAVTGDEARVKMKELVSKGEVGGLLGYANEKCVAWLSVDPINTQVGHDYVVEGHSKTENTWTIHCVYVAPEQRGQGFSKPLIQAGIDYAKSKGAIDVIVFPIPEETRTKFPEGEAEFSGRYSTFKKMGFKDQQRLNDFYQVMKLEI